MTDVYPRCSVSNCHRRRWAKGLCSAHYKKLRKYGDPLGYHEGRALRFLRETVANPPIGCAVWEFATTREGYGRIRHNGRFRSATQVALEMSGRPKPSAEHQAAHAPAECHNPGCVNPRHLRWATPSENAADMLIDGTKLRGEANASAKLTCEEALAIYHSTETYEKLGAIFGVSTAAVSHIKNGRNWAWLTGASAAA